MVYLTNIVVCIVLGSVVFDETSGHGRVMEPAMRSSVWRLPEFADRNPPINYSDNGLFCGGKDVQHNLNGGKCGICGDPYNQTHPRDNEDGGIYDAGIIVRDYYAGQIMHVEVNLTATHKGYMEFRLCGRDDVKSHLDQSCYDENILERPNGKGTKYWITQESGTHYASYDLVLPTAVNCRRCVLQWTYITGNSWGTCEDTGESAPGCGPQENFRGCSDIAIYKHRISRRISK